MYDIALVNFYNPYFHTPREQKVWLRCPRSSLQLVSILESNGFKINFKDLQLENIEEPFVNNVMSFFKKFSEDTLWINCINSELPLLLLSLRKIKEENESKKIILNSDISTGMGEKILEYFPFIDVIILGRSKGVVGNLITSLSDRVGLEKIRGIAYRKGDKVLINSPSESFGNFNKLPLPAYNKLNSEKYSLFDIPTSEGCQYGCTFCSYSTSENNKVIYRDLDEVIEEIRIIKENKKRDIFFVDAGFSQNEKRALELCKKLKDEQIDIIWQCFGNINHMNEKLMKEFRSAGCNVLYLDVESGSNRVLKRIDTKFQKEKALEIVEKSQKYFWKVVVFFIWNFPFETVEDFRETLMLIDKIRKFDNVEIRLNTLSPNPNSRIYRDYKDNLVFSENEEGYLQTFLRFSVNINKEGVNVPKHIPPILSEVGVGDMIKTFPKIFPSFYHYEMKNFEEKKHILERYLKI